MSSLVPQSVCGRGGGTCLDGEGWQCIGSPSLPPLPEDGPAAWLNCFLPSPGRCPKPLKNRDVITLRSWLPMGADYIIMNYSVKHPVSCPPWMCRRMMDRDFRQAWGSASFLHSEENDNVQGLSSSSGEGQCGLKEQGCELVWLA